MSDVSAHGQFGPSQIRTFRPQVQDISASGPRRFGLRSKTFRPQGQDGSARASNRASYGDFVRISML
ncbi:Hypp1303 [Branchiostoma lanceolatum]|uniref:Hypp1303 protein n=1 Tax=Branchiostoma lanceolatum TaxID=7740 RepID=A0A8J9ZG82_BRALA|nr:Hypp1303 [Branchiostoma lanceolatum]